VQGIFKWTVSGENRPGNYILAQDVQITIFNFWLALKQKVIYVHVKSTLKHEKSIKNLAKLG
jgi:hypothetical protein